MSRKDHHIFDHSLHEANTWLNEIRDELNAPDLQVAYHALRGVLFVTRDQLTIEEAMDFASQLPVLIRGIYFEAYRPTDKPEKLRSKDELLQRIDKELQACGGFDPEKAFEGVFNILQQRISEGQIHHILSAFPERLIPANA